MCISVFNNADSVSAPFFNMVIYVKIEMLTAML